MSVQARLAAMRPHQVFLVDGLGALVSTLLLGIMMVRFESIFGMPASVLYALAAIAAGFSLYSILCWVIEPANWRPWLRGIASANLLYCCLTVGLVITRQDDLSLLGTSYFAGEIAVVVVLALFELRVASNPVAANDSANDSWLR
tara:strand:- start:24312 stop:24746 length:435 start_codon:yes stop_codon:yes gene_type:complete